MKRVFDVGVAGLLLIVTAPLWPIIAALIKLESPGPVLYRATRVGRNGRCFVLYKFRTMKARSSASRLTHRSDGRITRVGKYLRRTKLDELPNLVNVIKGDMSLVGPRPEDPYYVAMYPAEAGPLLTLRPGITSLASIDFRDETELLGGTDDEAHRIYVEEILPRKLELEREYLRRQSLLLDLRIVLRTIRVVIRANSRARASA